MFKLGGSDKDKTVADSGEKDDDIKGSPQLSKSTQDRLSMISVSADIEKLKMEGAANSEIRKLNIEKFTQISEQIGELRNMILQLEKARQQIEIKAEKASGLVESVQPEKLMISVNKTDFKVEALKAKVEANELLNSKIKEDLRDMRNKFAIFRNTQMIKDLNEDSKKRFNAIQKVEAEIIRHSDKVDSIFSEVQKSFAETKETSKIVKDMQEALTKLITENEKLKINLAAKSGKADLDKLRDEMKKNNKKVVDVVMHELADFKKKAIKELEVGAKKTELSVIQQMIREDFGDVSGHLKELKKEYEGLEVKELKNKKRIDKILDMIRILSIESRGQDGKGTGH